MIENARAPGVPAATFATQWFSCLRRLPPEWGIMTWVSPSGRLPPPPGVGHSMLQVLAHIKCTHHMRDARPNQPGSCQLLCLALQALDQLHSNHLDLHFAVASCAHPHVISGHLRTR